MIVVDTTVLVYAVGDAHPLREPSRGIVDAIAGGTLAATSTVEVVQEFVHVRARRHGRASAVTVGREFAALLSPLLPTDDSTLDGGLDLYEQHEGLGAFDSVLAAAAVAHGANAFVSADRAFADVDGLPYVDLASENLLARLS